jgi:hypothetical protein
LLFLKKGGNACHPIRLLVILHLLGNKQFVGTYI